MPVTFLQQYDRVLSNSIRDGCLGEPMVEHIGYNKHKHVHQPQVHLIG